MKSWYSRGLSELNRQPFEELSVHASTNSDEVVGLRRLSPTYIARLFPLLFAPSPALPRIECKEGSKSARLSEWLPVACLAATSRMYFLRPLRLFCGHCSGLCLGFSAAPRENFFGFV